MNDRHKNNHDIKAVLFDFGGVLADEGYREGMTAIALKNQVSVDEFLKYAFQVIYDIGFTLGKSSESVFWDTLRKKYGIHGTDEELSEELLSRFVPREWMFEIISDLSQNNIGRCILSDQTTWLDELDRRFGFFHKFDHVFNSYHMGITKKDPQVFDLVLEKIGQPAQKVLFVDDYKPHIDRAESKGLNVIQYISKDDYIRQMKLFFPEII